MTRLTLVHNPSAGKDGPAAAELTKLFEDSGYTVRYCDIRNNLDNALASAADLVVVAGGDGTVAEVLLRASATRVPIAILPLGSANNIASALGHMRPLREIVTSLRHAVARRFDIGVARGPWGRRRFVEGVGFGPLASALAAAGAVGVPGDHSVRLGRAVFRTLLDEAKPARLHIRLDGRTLADDFAMVEVLNIGQIGPRLRLAPSADPSDRLLDVVCVPFTRCDEMLAWLGDPDAVPPPLNTYQASVVEITCAHRIAVHIDDEFPKTAGEDAREIQISLEDDYMTVLRPLDEERARA